MSKRGWVVTALIVVAVAAGGFYFFGGDPVVGKWSPSQGSSEYFEFGRFGGLKQYQLVNFKSGRTVYVTTQGSWERRGNSIRLKVTKADPPDITVPDADLELVSVTSTELKYRRQDGGTGTLYRVR